jgi:hypothetical protein
MSRTLGIDFGYSTTTASLGYIRFETQTGDGKATVSVESPSKISTLADFKSQVLKDACANGVSVIALDAPITPKRISGKPKSGRQVEKRFSRGDFHNTKRGPQPSSVSVPKQGWPLYCGAMDLMADLHKFGFMMPLITGADEKAFVDFSGKVCVEVCPKMTQSLLASKSRVVSRPNKHGSPTFYRQIDNWLFSHLFVTDALTSPNLSGNSQPSWGADRSGMCHLLGDRVQFDKSVWDEATRISTVRPLSERHELIGAFVAGFQGAIALAGASVAVGASGDYEGYYVLPLQWHADWTEVWKETRRDEDSVKRFPIRLPKHPASPCKSGGH